MKLLVLWVLVSSTASAARKDPCLEQCAATRSRCVTACEEAKGPSKSKKNAAECVKKMCEPMVHGCESDCRHAKKK